MKRSKPFESLAALAAMDKAYPHDRFPAAAAGDCFCFVMMGSMNYI